MERNFADSVPELAINLFIAFTTDIIHAITLDYVKGVYPGELNSLEDAMSLWTVDSMDALLHHTEFVASNFGLEGTVMGPRDRDPNHVDIFFPETSEGLKDSGWHAALQWGYLNTFFAFKKALDPTDFEALRVHLGSILRRLQCLPVAVLPRSQNKGALWKQGKMGFQIWVNPAYYRLKRLAVVKGSVRPRMKKGLKSLAEQAKDFRGRGEEERNKHLDGARMPQVVFPGDGGKNKVARKEVGKVKKPQMHDQTAEPRKEVQAFTMEEFLPDEDGYEPSVEEICQAFTKAKKKHDRRSGKSKNKRVPPPPRKTGESMPVKKIVDVEKEKRKIEFAKIRAALSDCESD